MQVWLFGVASDPLKVWAGHYCGGGRIRGLARLDVGLRKALQVPTGAVAAFLL